MKNSIATSKTSGNKFPFRYQVFNEGRNTMHSCEIEVAGEWRPADVFVKGEELHGICEFFAGGQRNDVKFIVSPTEDTVRMVEYAKEDAAQYAAEKAARREAEMNQENFIY